MVFVPFQKQFNPREATTSSVEIVGITEPPISFWDVLAIELPAFNYDKQSLYLYMSLLSCYQICLCSFFITNASSAWLSSGL